MKTTWEKYLARFHACADGAAAIRRSELQLTEVKGAFEQADDDAGKKVAVALTEAAAALELARQRLLEALDAARIKGTRSTTNHHQEVAHVR